MFTKECNGHREEEVLSSRVVLIVLPHHDRPYYSDRHFSKAYYR